MQLDPLESAAFSIYQNKGAYALLLGSGLSRSAGIPTGWEIVLGLIGKLAALRNENPEPSPEAWYRERSGQAPSYDSLVEAVAKTRDERSSLLRSYIEPTEEDRERGRKVPQAAHRAIASLVQSGYVKVLITTNFDPLLEMAIEDAGVVPDVISTADQIKGARPLHQMRCLVLKVNGDYRDTRIRNTEEELSVYEAELDAFLDRLLDEFGLLVCGWSADYDVALCNAVFRCPSRRYTPYWTARRGTLRPAAERLVNHRQATVIAIEDADTFLPRLADKVVALDSSGAPHPLSVAAAVASVKRAIDKGEQIRLHDLVTDEAEGVRSAIMGPDFPVFVPQNSPGSVSWPTLLSKYEATTEQFLHVMVTLSFFGNRDSESLVSRIMERLAESSPPARYSTPLLLHLRRYPALLAVYGVGLAAWDAGKTGFLRAALTDPVAVSETGERQPLLDQVNVQRVLPKQAFTDLGPEEYRQKHTPGSDYLFSTLRPLLRQVIPSDSAYERAFDLFEYFLAVVYRGAHPGEGWAPVGPYAWRPETEEAVGELQARLRTEDGARPYLAAGFFGGDPQRLTVALQEQEKWYLERRSAWW
jgi:hypothetical protein